VISEKLIEVLSSPPDAALTLVTQGEDGAHLANSWNSYARIEGNRLLLPVGGMRETERNLAVDSTVKLSISNREVQGLTYRGTGFLLTGNGEVRAEGPDYEKIKDSFPWARAVLIITVTRATQTL